MDSYGEVESIKILFIPQEIKGELSYAFQGEKIIATMNGITDEFDFSDLPDGELQLSEFVDGNHIPRMETTLEENPILFAKRENGVLWVELLNFISENATEEERYPDWIEV